MVRSVLCFGLLLRLLLLASLLLLVVLLLLFFHHHRRHFPNACRRLSRFLRDTAAVVTADAVAAGAAGVGAAVVAAAASFSGSSSSDSNDRENLSHLGPDEKLGFILTPDIAEHRLTTAEIQAKNKPLFREGAMRNSNSVALILPDGEKSSTCAARSDPASCLLTGRGADNLRRLLLGTFDLRPPCSLGCGNLSASGWGHHLLLFCGHTGDV